MVLIITQETFDNAVKENIEDLGLEAEEAVLEAIVQFQKQVSYSFKQRVITIALIFQGVDLSNIVKKLAISDDKMEVIAEALKTLENANKTKSDSKQIMQQLELIRTECDKGIDMKVAAGG